MSHETGAEGSDSAVYPELARANLLRMRGDYKAAESQCLTILRRYPNNTTANVLLGDICAEKGELDQAMQWYEMALDLAPESQAAEHKLQAVRQRFKEKETAQTVEQLGLPTTKSRAGIYAAALIAAIFVVAVVMYFLGQHVEKGKEGTTRFTDARGPIIETGSSLARPNDGSDVHDDSELLKTIQATGTEGARVLEAYEDPRSHSITVSYSVLQGEDPRALGAIIAQQTFEQVAQAPVVTVRGVQKGNVVYVSDAIRALFEETLSPTWTAEHTSNPNAWMDHILTHEWPEPAAAASTPSEIVGGQNVSPDTGATTEGDKQDSTNASDDASSDQKPPQSSDATPSVDTKTSDQTNDATNNASPTTGPTDNQSTSGPPGDDF